MYRQLRGITTKRCNNNIEIYLLHDIHEGMNKLSIGKNLLNLEQNIKNDAMRPTIGMMIGILAFMTLLIIVTNDKIIHYFCMLIIFGSISYTIYINHYFAKNDPDRLQTEKFLIHKRLIESGMIENRQGTILDTNVQNSLPPNTPIYLAENVEETNEVEE